MTGLGIGPEVLSKVHGPLHRLLIEGRKRLMLENLALRQQLAVLKRSVSQPKIEDSDRIFWILLRRVLGEWKETLHFVKPDTVVKWHRRGFRYYWRRKSESVRGGMGGRSVSSAGEPRNATGSEPPFSPIWQGLCAAPGPQLGTVLRFFGLEG